MTAAPPLVTIAAMLIGVAAAAQPFAGAPSDRPYRVECPVDADPDAGVAVPCRTDVATYVGRLVFDEHCASCHAVDALGSSFAPALADRVRRLNRAQFLRLLEQGYVGDASALPKWAEIPDVGRYAEALWVYLLARANDDLPPGPIELLPDAGRP